MHFIVGYTDTLGTRHEWEFEAPSWSTARARFWFEAGQREGRRVEYADIRDPAVERKPVEPVHLNEGNVF